MIQIKIYAPIIIPTLCRHVHFKRCVESLARCTGAKNTELFIGLDYPGNESHWEGYKEISKYVETIVGFKKVHIFRRDVNYGAFKNGLNLKEEVAKRFDRYILTEDDNEFSPNFLEYINKGLELYKDDPNVVAICGYSYPFDYCEKMEGYPYNAYPMKSFCAWGTGYWFEKYNKIRPQINQKAACNIVHSWRLVYKLFDQKLHITVHRLLFRYKMAYGDLMWHSYCVLNNVYCIFPHISKVRNYGFDGKGLNCIENPIYAEQKIDESSLFDFDDFKIKPYKSITMIHDRLYGGTWGIRRLCEIEYLMFRFFGVSFQNGIFQNSLLKKYRQSSNRSRT